MRTSLTNELDAPPPPRPSEQASARTSLLLLAVCLLGIAGGAFWFYRASQNSPAGADMQTTGTPASLLSETTRNVLRRLESPLEIHFYALLDPAAMPDSVTAFAGRVGRLLSAYEQEAGGKIKVISVTSLSDPKANTAPADGITPFNLDKGEACYLGIRLVLKGHKETLPHLSPEWDQALEPDLTRAIIRLEDGAQPAIVPTLVSQVNTTAVKEVRALIPDVSAVSLQAGKQILQDAAYKEYATVAKEMQAQLKEAEQSLARAQNGGTDAERQAALQHFQQVQADQAEKLKAIAAKSQAQIDTFQQLKAAPH